jgi:isocitrate/isopropylmalate dehydrogenase
VKTYQIGVINGDGIGPELMISAKAVLEAVCSDQVQLDFHEEDGGADTYLRTGANLSADALGRIREKYDATLKGPVGLPQVRKPDGTEGGLLGGTLRGGLDAYANVRPIRSFPNARTPMRLDQGRIDYVIVRENTEGLYLSRGLGVGNDRASSDQLLMTRVGVERVAHFAFKLALRRNGSPKDGVRRVTCVDKSNVIRTYAFFRQIFTEVAQHYPDIEVDYRYADAAGHDLVFDPCHFDVLVMENFLGDILSDVGAATVGGLGMCASGNIGDASAYFEPIHGSAPTIAGRNLANPVSQILSAAMMLRHIGEAELGARIEAAVELAFERRAIEILDSGSPLGGTTAVTEAVLAALEGTARS